MLAFNHFFAGSNTCMGFYGVFDSVFDIKRLNRLFILKGGPGVGKSSLMKRIARHAEGLGLGVCYCHCSSDPESLDGIIISELGIALVDGTSPHTLDPTLPGAADKIINLGAGLDEKKLTGERKHLEGLQSDMKKEFRLSNLLASAADSLRSSTYSGSHDPYAVLHELLPVCAQKGRLGDARHIFLSALTPNGIMSFLPDTVELPKWDMHADDLQTVAAFLMGQGADCVLCHDPINPSRLEYVLFDGGMLLGTGVKLPDMYDELITASASHLDNARKLHSELEAPYIEAMDFSVCDTAFERIAGYVERG